MVPSIEKGLGALRQGMFSLGPDNQTRICQEEGCFETTRERKPYCTDHFKQHPYVQQLLKQLSERDAEDRRVLMEGSIAVNLDGITVKEIIQLLKQKGPRTEQRLIRELHLDSSMVHNYVVALRKKGLIKNRTTPRFDQVITLVGADEEDLIPDD
jgi:predicted HTH transcriptional regulator